MSLHIWLGEGKPPTLADTGLSFDDDDGGGYYWFLYPLFDHLAQEAGQHISLYGVAEFGGDSLHALRRTLFEARRLTLTQPERWAVYVGTETMPNAPVPPPPQEVYKEVERSTLLTLVDGFLDVVERAQATGLSVVCLGD